MTRIARLFFRPRTAAMIALFCVGIAGTVYAFDAVRQIGIAHADTDRVSVAAAPPVAMQTVQAVEPAPAPMSSGSIAFFVVLTVLTALSAIGHVIAPRTKTTIDDRGLAKLDELLGLVRTAAPPTPVVSVTGPQGDVTTVRLPQSGRVRLEMAAIFAVVAMLTLPLIGCGTLSNAPGAAKDAIIDCAKADAAAITVLVSELGADAVTTALGTGTPDWHKLESDAIAQGKVIGGCAPAAPTTQSFVAQASPADDGRAALERFRAQMGGGRWSTEVR